jgi:hypothetical protein
LLRAKIIYPDKYSIRNLFVRKQTRSILEEITNIVPQRDKESFVENKAINVIASTKYLVEYIQENFPKDQSDDLLKRLFNSLKTGDEMKFRRGIKQIKESKHGTI